LQKTIGSIDYAVVSMACDNEGEFLFVGEKNGGIKIWNLGVDSDTLKQSIEIGTSLNALTFDNKYFSVIALATGKGLLIRDIKNSTDIFKFQPAPHVSCTSLSWDLNRNYLFAGFTDGIIRVFKFSTSK